MTSNQKAARMARIVGIGGAVAIMVLIAGLSYSLKGQINILALLCAGFFAGFHILGCELFVRHFKALEKGEGDE